MSASVDSRGQSAKVAGTDQTTLVLGATGTTGSRVAALLSESGQSVLKASRSGADGFVRFDWFDQSTWPNVVGAFDRLYLVAPIGVPEPRPVVRPFLEAAVKAGLKRTILLSSSAVEPGIDGLGALHSCVTEVSPEWGVLRPSWFMQNFTGDLAPARGLRQGSVVTATQGGRIGFVDASDIAAVANKLLMQDDPLQDEFVLTGPEALAFADVCAIASSVLNRTVDVADVSPDQLVDYLASAGVPREFAQVLASLDESIALGTEDRLTDTVEQLTGRKPKDMRAYLTQDLALLPLLE